MDMDVEEYEDMPSIDKEASKDGDDNSVCTTFVVVAIDTNLMRPVFVNIAEPSLLRVGRPLTQKAREYIEKIESDIVKTLYIVRDSWI